MLAAAFVVECFSYTCFCFLFQKELCVAPLSPSHPLSPSPTAPPADNGGKPVTGFVVELCGGSERRLETEEPLVDIRDLTPGTAYEVRIAATSDGRQGEVLSGEGGWGTSYRP